MRTLKYIHIPERYVRTKSDRKFIDDGGTFDVTRGERVVKFIQTFMTPTRGLGADQKVTLTDWQKHELIIPLFSYIKRDGFRRYTRGMLGIPRQNGKSFVTSAIGTYMLMADNEPAPYVVVSATQRKQTKIVFSEILNTLESSPELKKWIKPREATNQVVYPAKNGRLEGISSENWAALGDPPHCFIADEFAFWDRYEPWTAVVTGSGSRNQPLYLAITTAGTDRTTPAYALWKHAEAVQSSLIVDEGFFPLIYASKPEDDIHDPTVWKKCNPSLGTFLKDDDFKAWSERAKRDKIEALQLRQFKLNQWVSSTNAFIDLNRWEDCTCKDFPDLTGKDAVCALDISSTQDLTSCVCVIPHEGKYYVDHHSFCCGDTIRKRESQNVQRYSVFKDEGSLTEHEGVCIDLDRVRDHIRGLCSKYNLRSIAIDAAHNALDTFIILEREGLPVVKMSCNPVTINTPMRRLGDLVNGKKLAHRGDSMINWQVQNLEMVNKSKDLIYWAKPSNDAKIDVMAALIMALSQVIVTEAEDKNKPSLIFEIL